MLEAIAVLGNISRDVLRFLNPQTMQLEETLVPAETLPQRLQEWTSAAYDVLGTPSISLMAVLLSTNVESTFGVSIEHSHDGVYWAPVDDSYFVQPLTANDLTAAGDTCAVVFNLRTHFIRVVVKTDTTSSTWLGVEIEVSIIAGEV